LMNVFNLENSTETNRISKLYELDKI